MSKKPDGPTAAIKLATNLLNLGELLDAADESAKFPVPPSNPDWYTDLPAACLNVAKEARRLIDNHRTIDDETRCDLLTALETVAVVAEGALWFAEQGNRAECRKRLARLPARDRTDEAAYRLRALADVSDGGGDGAADADEPTNPPKLTKGEAQAYHSREWACKQQPDIRTDQQAFDFLTTRGGGLEYEDGSFPPNFNAWYAQLVRARRKLDSNKYIRRAVPHETRSVVRGSSIEYQGRAPD